MQVIDDSAASASKDSASKRIVSVAPTREEIMKKMKYEWGRLDVDLFIKKLMQEGITDIQVDNKGPHSVTIILVGEDTQIRLEEGNTHIVCGGKQSLRLKLRDLLMQCVQKF